MYENLKRFITELKSTISDLKVQEGTLKVINDEFVANVVRLEKALKTARAEASQEGGIGDKIDTPETIEENLLQSPCPSLIFSLLLLPNSFYLSNQFGYFQTMFCGTFFMSLPLLIKLKRESKSLDSRTFMLNDQSLPEKL